MLAAITFTDTYQWAGLLAALVVICGVPIALWRWMLNRIVKEVTPNGGDTLRLGDRVLRTEESTLRTEAAVNLLVVSVATQKGHTDTVEAEVFSRLNKLETRSQAERRRASDDAAG